MVDDSDGSRPELTFSGENGEQVLARHFSYVQRRDMGGSVLFPDRDAVVEHVSSTLTRAHLTHRVPEFDGPLRVTSDNVLFVAIAR
jgi:hypothetical protein